MVREYTQELDKGFVLKITGVTEWLYVDNGIRFVFQFGCGMTVVWKVRAKIGSRDEDKTEEGEDMN